jgi:dihydroxy-acid dehydratase
MGSASTGQVFAEALGLALPGSALIPTPLTRHLRYARATGKLILKLIAEDITPRRILTREAFENAIILHAAVGGCRCLPTPKRPAAIPSSTCGTRGVCRR